jgi:hypothetical protein
MIMFILLWQLTCLTQPYALIPLSALLPAYTTASSVVADVSLNQTALKGGHYVKD